MTGTTDYTAVTTAGAYTTLTPTPAATSTRRPTVGRAAPPSTVTDASRQARRAHTALSATVPIAPPVAGTGVTVIGSITVTGDTPAPDRRC